MEQLKPLSEFFNAIAGDPRISITHIGLYAALLQYWAAHHCQNPVEIRRREIMQLAKISTRTTYNKCIKDLNQYGYIRYEPSFNPRCGSQLYLLNTDR